LPIVAPTNPEGPICAMFLTILILHCIRKLSFQSELFCSVVPKKKIFKVLHLIFALLWVLPFEEDMAVYLNKLEFFYSRMICTQKDLENWNWLADSEEEYFKENSFANIFPWRRSFPFIRVCLNPLSHRMICFKSV
jgi:hypothetical protein